MVSYQLIAQEGNKALSVDMCLAMVRDVRAPLV
ncbi:hypothetical protein FOXG_21551 [Fusarium oxysporum f. sp. lycopersici 4287]|uniref:Uncharacterized protein n=1 Tax=Fusarium oxysporum f. sp. lycopersici (strain 4287 / CBS 123668 / FGSC 9935 / NRRL 34936) TaxID=426428 RepID=A0A0J9VYV7_FUSO4|nr:hypothetical protein FOXG_21551 [Fusarium oxysporum f. sp. lycopersici 4287]EWZ78236.1 hypothetical protein FOWG_17472 [Fusarium oxysporum f. sp. lycopersici MN25]KNB15981.1 hypothetical protein FOXG_21551 [Fusarium oxysporum f. sp. lycopersici 4287]